MMNFNEIMWIAEHPPKADNGISPPKPVNSGVSPFAALRVSLEGTEMLRFPFAEFTLEPFASLRINSAKGSGLRLTQHDSPDLGRENS